MEVRGRRCRMKITDQAGNTQSVGVRATKSPVRIITVEEFLAEARAQGAKTNEDIVFVCPACGTLQSGKDLIAAGAGKTFDDVAAQVGYSCIGRWHGAGDPRPQQDGKACNWSLGGLLHIHQLEIIAEDGEQCPRFALATPEQAQAHRAQADGGKEAA